MKRTGAIFLVLILCLFVSAEASARMKWMGSGGWGMGSGYNTMYDVNTVETITGTVSAIEEMTPMSGMSEGVHITVMTEKETIAVHLGPSWFIENQDMRIETRNMVEVKGSRVTFNGKPAIIASEVIKGDAVLKLRDENGVPVWAAMRRR